MEWNVGGWPFIAFISSKHDPWWMIEWCESLVGI